MGRCHCQSHETNYPHFHPMHLLCHIFFNDLRITSGVIESHDCLIHALDGSEDNLFHGSGNDNDPFEGFEQSEIDQVEEI
jgi:hypothetical protein